MIKVTVGGQDVALDLSRTLAQSGIRPGSTLKLKLTGLLGGMPTRHPCNWPPDAFYAFTPADLPQSMGAVMDPRRTIPASAS